MKLDVKIEALLLVRGESIEISELAKILNVKKPELLEALEELERKLVGRAVELQRGNGAVALATSSHTAPFIEKMHKDELEKDIGKAGADTLSIILYKNPVTRSEIEYIRGVNSTSILRNLLMRGLVSRVQNPKDQRGYLYTPTFELLSFLGITSVEELPDFDKVKRELVLFEQELKEENGEKRADIE